MAAIILLGARRCLQLASADACSVLPARALAASQCSCSYTVLEAYRPFRCTPLPAVLAT